MTAAMIVARPDRGSILTAHSEVLAGVETQREGLATEIREIADALEQAVTRKWVMGHFQ